MLRITKVNKFYKSGALVTTEKTFKVDATMEEVEEIAMRQGADIDEIKEEIEEYGIASFKGYMVDVIY